MYALLVETFYKSLFLGTGRVGDWVKFNYKDSVYVPYNEHNWVQRKGEIWDFMWIKIDSRSKIYSQLAQHLLKLVEQLINRIHWLDDHDNNEINQADEEIV